MEHKFPVEHVFVLMLENHSFDNIFGQSGIPGIVHATAASSNMWRGSTYHVSSPAPLSMTTDPGHEFLDVVQQLTGGPAQFGGGPYPRVDNSGFALNYATTTTEGKPPEDSHVGDVMLGFDTQIQLPVLYELATRFTLCDHWFSSMPGPTWPNRFFVHGASSVGFDHSPSDLEIIIWAFLKGFTYPHGSIYQRLRDHGIGWRLYNDSKDQFTDGLPSKARLGGVPIVAGLRDINLWTVRPLDKFESDLQGNYPYFYTFIEPNYGDVLGDSYQNGSSQHPKDDPYGGEALIKSVYETIRLSPIWESSMLVITYDEHGGFYDCVPPPSAVSPRDGEHRGFNRYGFLFDRLGVRVPAVIVSPWVAAGVDSSVYDHSSILATLGAILRMQGTDFEPFTSRDAHAQDLIHLIQPTIRPESECPITLPIPVRASDRLSPTMLLDDEEPITRTGNVPGFLGILLKTELEMSSGTEATREMLVERFRAIQTVGEARAYIGRVIARVRSGPRSPMLVSKVRGLSC